MSLATNSQGSEIDRALKHVADEQPGALYTVVGRGLLTEDA